MSSASADTSLPRHIAITMDGNGRWAAARGLPRIAGHKAGLQPVRMVIEECSRRGVPALTLFAFSSENWRRPAEEVGSLMTLFIDALDREIDELDAKRVRMRFIGERRSLGVRLQRRILAAEMRTAAHTGLKLQVAMSYGGRWDIIEAARQVARECASGALRAEDLDETAFAAHLALAGLPQTDLMIRTGGEQRLSNFLLWDLAYAELYFTERLWPEFAVGDLEAALAFFAGRERRFGLTGAQLPAAKA
ncbi:MAG: di-trans,poly-cis-decaprenylcistransferase [Gammaproteobacteria bacterium]|nr:di-trans,poly-cis-decaprenylcistransferase [Gammaproteobacteria bacterium]